MLLSTKLRLRLILVWVCRVLTGTAFIVAGWAKAIDPWGFMIKVGSYLTAWDIELPREVVLTGCVGLSCIEFLTGVLLLVGALKRVAAVMATAMMAFMLPLTLYIVIANPVSDCGCFGDFIVISNEATFVKNIFLTIMSVYLLKVGFTVRGVYPAPVQWLVVTVSLAFPMLISFLGYYVQPLIDFRPYKVGTLLFDKEREKGEEVYVYVKDGVEKEFTLSELPDSTWTFDRVEELEVADDHGFAVRDAYGEDALPEIRPSYGKILYLLVAEPDVQFLSRAHYVNRLKEYAAAHGVRMIGIAGADGEELDQWVALTRPHFPVYSAEDTALKQLARGDAALVYVIGGAIVWKRNLAGMDARLPDTEGDVNALDLLAQTNARKVHLVIAGFYLIAMVLLFALGQSPKMLRHLGRLAEMSRR